MKRMVMVAAAGVLVLLAFAFGEWPAKLYMHVMPPKPEVPFAERLAAAGRASGDAVFIRIFKEESELELWLDDGSGYALVETYPVCTWSGTLGPKLKEGDGQSPEGFYAVTRSSLNPNSRYHLSFNLGFPNAFDQAHGRTGSYLMVHGGCVSSGCYAMTDPAIEEIYTVIESALKKGQKEVPVHAFPFHMNEQNMARHEGSQWFDFWSNLREGYSAFESTRTPPRIHARDGRYVVVS